MAVLGANGRSVPSTASGDPGDGDDQQECQASADAATMQPVHLEQVREAEFQDIVARRSHVDRLGVAKSSIPQGEELARNNLVGLALSGGGLRSSAFSLGVFQALYQHRLIPSIDYLSTVSGGGYAGAYLSSLARQDARRPDNEVDSNSATQSAAANETAPPEAKGDWFTIAAFEAGQQRSRMLRFIHSGKYLLHMVSFLNHYVIGTALNLSFAVCFLLAGTSLIAWLCRCMDYPGISNYVNVLGYRTDVGRTLYPASFLFGLWLCVGGFHAIGGLLKRVFFEALNSADPEEKVVNSARRSRIMRMARRLGVGTRCSHRYIFLASIFALVAGVASLLGTGDIDIASLMPNSDTSGSESNFLSQAQGFLRTVIFSLIGASLIPYLKPASLIRSGVAPKNVAERYGYWAATRALLFGVPFVLVAYFAQENLSGWHEGRPPYLHRDDVMTEELTAPLFVEKGIWDVEPAFEFDNEMPQGIRLAIADDGVEFARQRLDKIAKQNRLAQLAMSVTAQDSATSSNATGSAIRSLGSWINHCWYGLTWHWATIASRVNTSDIESNTQINGKPSWEQNRQHPFEVAYQTQKETARLRDEVTVMLNRRLANRNLRKSLAPIASDWSSVQAYHPDDMDQPLWAKGVNAAIDNCTVIANQIVAAQGTLDTNSIKQLRHKMLAANRELLVAYYGTLIKRNVEVYARNVLTHDQSVRWQWFYWSFTGMLLFGLVVNMNSTSWHGYYSERIAETWIEGTPEFRQSVRLQNWNSTDQGLPYHLISATLHTLGKRRYGALQPSAADSAPDSPQTKQARTPTKDLPRTEHFLFSRRYCGSSITGYSDTSKFDDGNYRVRDALGISGAAVTPMLTDNLFLTVLLFLCNIRLGQWLPHPALSYQRATWQQWMVKHLPIGPARAIFNACCPIDQRSLCFVADGGHYENLAIEPLLARRCKLIIAVDVTEDAKMEFRDFVRMLRLARLKHGIRITPSDTEAGELNLADQVRVSLVDNPHGGEKLPRASKHYFTARIHYPKQEVVKNQAPSEAYLVYMKSSMSGDESPELLNFQADNPSFPHDPTSDQFYDADRFESYRQLGEHIADGVARDMTYIDRNVGKLYDPEKLIQALISGRSYFAKASSKSTDLIGKVINGELSIREREGALFDLDSESDGGSLIPALVDVLAQVEGKPLLRMRTALVLTTHGRNNPELLAQHGLNSNSHSIRLITLDIFSHIVADVNPTQMLVVQIMKSLDDTQVDNRIAAGRVLKLYADTYVNDPKHWPTMQLVARRMLAVMEADTSAEARSLAVTTLRVITEKAHFATHEAEFDDEREGIQTMRREFGTPEDSSSVTQIPQD